MVFNTRFPSEIKRLHKYIDSLIDGKHKIEVFKNLEGRSTLQNGARWLYLTMVANELNERGDTIDFNGVISKYTKDSLYNNVWQILRTNMFPDKSRLTTKDFSELSEFAMITFSTKFSIDIPWPDKTQTKAYLDSLKYKIE